MADVFITNYGFVPNNITINVDETVTFHNDHDEPHTVTSNSLSDSFDSYVIQPDSAWSHEFTVDGSFDYYCKMHPNFHGTVTVR